MGYELPFEKKACAENASKMKNIAFFNDSFRDILKGPTFQDKIKNKGFVNGDFSYVDGYHYSFMGSVTDFCFKAKFLSTNQTINYVECHDNNTLFDKLTHSNPEDDKEILYSRVKLANALVLLSFGIPLIHMGQEIGQSKYLLDNTYNTPKINNFDYEGLHNRYEMVSYLKNVISLRNNELSFFKKITSKEEIDTLFHFERTSEGLLILKSENNNIIAPYTSIKILINIHSHPVKYAFSDYHHVLFSNGCKIKLSDFNIKTGIVSPASLEILVTTKE
jgi:pullulanase